MARKLPYRTTAGIATELGPGPAAIEANERTATGAGERALPGRLMPSYRRA